MKVAGLKRSKIGVWVNWPAGPCMGGAWVAHGSVHGLVHGCRSAWVYGVGGCGDVVGMG